MSMFGIRICVVVVCVWVQMLLHGFSICVSFCSLYVSVGSGSVSVCNRTAGSHDCQMNITGRHACVWQLNISSL